MTAFTELKESSFSISPDRFSSLNTIHGLHDTHEAMKNEKCEMIYGKSPYFALNRFTFFGNEGTSRSIVPREKDAG
jgi:hypothetical protein